MSGSVPRYAPFLYIDTPPSRLGNSPVYPLYSPCFKALLLPNFGFLLPLLPFATWLPGKNRPRLSRSIFHPFYGVRFVNCTLLHIVSQSRTIQPKSIPFFNILQKLLIVLMIPVTFHIPWSFRETIKHISTTSRTPPWFYLSGFF